MSILIKGMEMPRNCGHCRMWGCCPALHYEEWPDYESIITNDVIGDGGAEPGVRHPDCPLIKVPEPHGRLIDADELLEHAWRDKLDSRELIAKMIDGAPTVIPASEEAE